MNSKENFSRILNSDAELSKEDKRELEGMSYKYPWFALPKTILIHNYKDKPQEIERLRENAYLSLLSCSYYNVISGELWDNSTPSPTNMEEDIIGDFLAKNVSKITINENPQPKTVVEPEKDDPEILEQLAQFLIKQGDFKQAIEIYSKLSLKFPEKSVYFADAIEKLKK